MESELKKVVDDIQQFLNDTFILKKSTKSAIEFHDESSESIITLYKGVGNSSIYVSKDGFGWDFVIGFGDVHFGDFDPFSNKLPNPPKFSYHIDKGDEPTIDTTKNFKDSKQFKDKFLFNYGEFLKYEDDWNSVD